MDKYAVEEKVQPKLAATETNCPTCGRTLVSKDKVNVLLCKHCGSEPFEEEADVRQDP